MGWETFCEAVSRVKWKHNEAVVGLGEQARTTRTIEVE